MGTTNTLDLNNRINELEKAVSGGDSAQANKKDIATEFSATTNYTAGCFVYYGGKLYQFNADHSAGAWDPTDAVEANVTDQVVSNAAAIAGLTASDVAYDNTDSGLIATDVQGAVDELRQADNIMMSDGTTSVEEALTANSLGTRVEITSYTQSNPYTAPSDGYFLVYLHPDSSGYGCIESTSCSIGGDYYDVDSSHNARYGIYVRKGMHLFCTGAPHYAAFISISKGD